ncbi:MAG: hypothetical protein E5X67_34890 [Mesorhizobium sp.]|uniref:hypothetical protein n=1 Tax=Mesorhizobium sp. TaxID=1871066 RepID=UPI00121D5F06|nr:hypothetical protein [Mesorhizobium sp.]TIP23071.1 MAG: hypothetical protein E5X67_34890 [Mesorhizobium sp.]
MDLLATSIAPTACGRRALTIVNKLLQVSACVPNRSRTEYGVFENEIESRVTPPAASANAGSQFETRVGAFYTLSILADSEPRGLVGARIQSVALQQRIAGHPLDDIVIHATNADGSEATLEIQAKRTMTFTASDAEFVDVVGQVWKAAQNPAFETGRYETAVAVSRTTTRIEQAVQEVLNWARQLPDATTFASNIRRKGFASEAMRSFVAVFADNLARHGAPNDEQTLWRLLRRFQVLVFDFDAVGSDYAHRARERCRFVLAADQAHRAGDLWSHLIVDAEESAKAGGARTRPRSSGSYLRKRAFGSGMPLICVT